MSEKLAPRKTPCASCPYRRDVPSGVWDHAQYEVLRKYDGSTTDQAVANATAVFMCHQADDHLCSGWVGCHDMYESLALRIHCKDVDVDAVLAYESPVPLFGSGAEAADHGQQNIENPGAEACAAIRKIVRVRTARGMPVHADGSEVRA